LKKKSTTIVDIAVKVGITPSAVSKAFSNNPRISNETKIRVFKAAQELGYKPNSLAIGLRKGESGLIGVVVPGVHYSFFSTAIKGIEELLTDRGYNVIIVQTRDSANLEARQLDGLMRARVDGIIASLAMETKDYSRYLTISQDIPVVLFDRTFSDALVSEVTVNDFEGAVIAVKHLLSMGYRRIAHLAGFEHVRPFKLRIEGYRSALNEAGILPQENYICQCAPNSKDGEAAMAGLLALDERPDAVFAASDYLAYGALQAVLKQGIKVPEEIGIVGFSNEEFSQQVTPALSTVDQYSERLGSNAAEILLEHLNAVKNQAPFISQSRVIEPKLIIRQSSARTNLPPTDITLSKR
jgi:LacI family transcriptional regulator